MFRNRKSSRRKGAGAVPLEYQGSNESHTILPSTSRSSNPMNDIQFQASEICPQNFLIFDETESSSRVMYHPGITNNLSYSHLDFHEPLTQEFTPNYMNNFQPGISSPHIEDSDYIDMLLSLDEDDQGESQEEQEEEMSTARTRGYDDGNSSPESCSSYMSKSQKLTYPSNKKSKNNGSSSRSNNKRKEARKMVQVLRGMLPGGDHMNTASVFDATVQHLKGLEEKVQRLGLSNPNRFGGN